MGSVDPSDPWADLNPDETPQSRSHLVHNDSFLTPELFWLVVVALLFFFILFYTDARVLDITLNLIRKTVLIIFFCFVTSVPWEWYRLYKTALSKKKAYLAKVPNFDEACVPSSAVYSLLMWLKDRITFSDDECEKLYESLLVDPFWKVTRVQAVSVCASRFFSEPMKLAASTIGQCFHLFFKEVPAQWQIPVFLACFIITCLIILSLADLEISTPLFSLRMFSKKANRRRKNVRGKRSDRNDPAATALRNC